MLQIVGKKPRTAPSTSARRFLGFLSRFVTNVPSMRIIWTRRRRRLALHKDLMAVLRCLPRFPIIQIMPVRITARLACACICHDGCVLVWWYRVKRVSEPSSTIIPLVAFSLWLTFHDNLNIFSFGGARNKISKLSDTHGVHERFWLRAESQELVVC